MYLIRFTLNFQINHKRGVEKYLDMYSKEIGKDLLNVKIEKYWKISGQFQAQFTLESAHTEKEKLVFEILMLANKVDSIQGFNWKVKGPHDVGNLMFECILNNEKDDQPLKWAHLQLEKGNII